jgi:hypothetical protein
MKKLGSYVLSTLYQKRANDMRQEAGGGMPTFHWGHLIAQTMAGSIPDSTAACSRPKTPAQDKRVSHDL